MAIVLEEHTGSTGDSYSRMCRMSASHMWSFAAGAARWPEHHSQSLGRPLMLQRCMTRSRTWISSRAPGERARRTISAFLHWRISCKVNYAEPAPAESCMFCLTTLFASICASYLQALLPIKTGPYDGSFSLQTACVCNAFA